MAQCRYCRMIEKTDPRYRIRRAKWDLGSEFPRCAWHWQFVCDRCGRRISFHGVAWCEYSEEFFCIRCALRHRKTLSSFWAWDYYYELWCRNCARHHPALDWLEFTGNHPWQRSKSAARALKGLSRRRKMELWGWVRWAAQELQSPSLRQVERAWDSAAEKWDASYGKYGDSYRQNIFNPVLFSLLGDVRGKRILDAGCGAGYLSRLLTENGGRVTGVDLSRKFIEIARGHEKRRSLGIRYEEADLANLSRFSTATFDIVASVYVLCDTRDCSKAICEIARVLKANGRFVFLIGHPCFGWQSGGWHKVPRDSQRTEDALYFKSDNYFRRGTLESQWGELPVLPSFHRPLSDYFHFLKRAGFLVRNLIEPRPIPKALRDRPGEWDREDRIPPVLIIDAIKPTAPTQPGVNSP